MSVDDSARLENQIGYNRMEDHLISAIRHLDPEPRKIRFFTPFGWGANLAILVFPRYADGGNDVFDLMQDVRHRLNKKGLDVATDHDLDTYLLLVRDPQFLERSLY